MVDPLEFGHARTLALPSAKTQKNRSFEYFGYFVVSPFLLSSVKSE